MYGDLVSRDGGPSPLRTADLRRQHRALRLEISELRAMIDSRRATQRTDGYRHMLAVLVGRLRERLVLHFELEEQEAQVAGPPAARAAAVAHFAAEHAALLAEAARIALQLRTPNAPPDVVAKTLLWLDAVCLHEQAEDELLAAGECPA
jgi:hypothetical protein